MFFVNNDNNNNDNGKDVVIQDILDTLHTFIYHTIRVDFRKYIKNPDKDTDDDD